MVEDGLKALLGRRKNRTLAIMLATKDELEEDGWLEEEEAEKLRSVILDQVNDFHDFCVDLLEAARSGQEVNQIALDRLESIAVAVGADT